jgi:hypothetical protein
VDFRRSRLHRGKRVASHARSHATDRHTTVNEAIEPLLDKRNQRAFRKREGSRASLFAVLDRPVLQPLPAERYVLAHWKTVRASIDYQIEVEQHYYSVPYLKAGDISRFTMRAPRSTRVDRYRPFRNASP